MPEIGRAILVRKVGSPAEAAAAERAFYEGEDRTIELGRCNLFTSGRVGHPGIVAPREKSVMIPAGGIMDGRATLSGEEIQMNRVRLITDLLKLAICSLAFILGAIAGGMIVTSLGLKPPSMPEGVDGSLAFLILLLESPLLAFTVILIANGLGGRFLPRAIALSFFTWGIYTLNTTIESLAFTNTSVEGALFTAVSFLPPAVLCCVAVAWLFPPGKEQVGLAAIVRGFFSGCRTASWIWRFAVAAVVFVPIYLFFGSLVAPLTAQYFQDRMFGLRMPSQGEIMVVLFVRSLLFLLACLPIIILWQRSPRRLFLNLGFALFMLVGFLYMLGAYYMPLAVRVPHTLEILADSYAHAGLLVLLLPNRSTR